MERHEIGLTPMHLRIQKAIRTSNLLTMRRTGASEAQVIAWGLDARGCEFAGLFDDLTEKVDEPVDLSIIRQKWRYEEPPTIEGLINELLIRDVLEQQANGGIYITPLGHTALGCLLLDCQGGEGIPKINDK